MEPEQRLSFGEVARLYDEARPSYPAALIEDVIDLAPLAAPLRALEIGAGTGIATRLFAQRGVAVHGIEPSWEMATIAAQHMAEHPEVVIECVDFEEWDPQGATFPLIYAAQAWHWITPQTGYAKARSLLQRGGLLAAFWNRPKWETCALRGELIDAFSRALPERSPQDPMHPASPSDPDMWEEWVRGVEGTAGLGWAKVRGYPWSHVYSTGAYLALLRTHSANIVLPDSNRDALLYEIGSVLERHGGRLELDYITWLYMARAEG